MTISRRRFVAAAGAAVAMPAFIRDVKAQAQFTFRLHHFLPPVSNGHAKMLAPWAKKVADASGGRIAIQIFPSMQLGGTPPQLFDQARDGVADIVWTLPGNTPGRFPLSEVFELPFIGGRLGITNAQASQEFATKYMMDETKEVKLLSYWAHDTGLIHSKKQVTTLDSLKGQKLRFPTRLAGEALKAAGVNAIGMPVPQVPESLAQGVIDGAVVPWEVVPAIKVHELVKYHTNIPGKKALYAASFFLAMNKAKFDALPPDLQKVMDDNSHLEFAKLAGGMWDSAGAEVKAMVEKRSGNVINTMPEADAAKWAELCKPVWATFADQLKAKGHDAAKLLAEAESLVAKYDKPA
jgi:TRAP-type C4-dicarboxylate transport system substrate-binding protein